MLSTLLVCAGFTAAVFAQSGNAPVTGGRRTVILNVIAHAPEGKVITKEDFGLYDEGIPQEIESFTPLDKGSRIVLMVDSSSNLKADADALQAAMTAIVNELYEDDQMMVVGYNESAEIIEDMTGDLTKLQAASKKLVRKGFPNLFDALIAVSDALTQQADTGFEKRVVILISDGYDSESRTKFDAALYALQDANIVLYALQTPDRTRGALLREKPKPPAALEKLTAGTGGAIYQFKEVTQSAKTLADEIRKNWYRLTYTPSGINTINTRNILLMPHVKELQLRTKGSHPGKYRRQ